MLYLYHATILAPTRGARVLLGQAVPVHITYKPNTENLSLYRDTPCKPSKSGKRPTQFSSRNASLSAVAARRVRVPDKQATKASKQNAAALYAASVWHERQQAGAWSATGQCSMGSAAGAAIRMLAAHSDRRADPFA